MNRNKLLNSIGIAYGADPGQCERNCELDAIIIKLSGGAVTPSDTFNGKLRQILELTV